MQGYTASIHERSQVGGSNVSARSRQSEVIV
jgi:hypothetical protein